MADLGGFNAGEVEPTTAFELIPIDWYEAIIIESEKKATKAGDGEYLMLKFQITDDKNNAKGRFQWVNLNLNNPNPQAVQIARGQLSAICRAVGVLTPKDSTELHNLPLLIRVGQETSSQTGELQNKVKGFKPKDGAVPVSTKAETKKAERKPEATKAGAAPWAAGAKK